MAFHHVPVMLSEVLAALQPQAGGVFADGTLGGGGHSEHILQAVGPTGMLYGIDRDEAAIRAATARLSQYPGFRAVRGNFHDVLTLLPDVKLDGGLLDLGLSSHQIDTAARGFSYHEDAPLDMRMDRSQGPTAAEWLNQVDELTFRQVLYDYADERWAARIAKLLIEARQEKPLETTQDLVRVVDRAIPKAVRRKDSGHPARQTFQAVRIAVNDELQPLTRALEDWVSLLKPGGRLCVISFHSIEDRIVKRCFQRLRNPCTCPPQLPVCTCNLRPVVRILHGGGIKPSAQECQDNPRARSALLRVAEKL